MTVVFTVNFFGGIGNVSITIFQAGQQIGSTLIFSSSGPQSMDLANGFYIASATGNSAPAGTDIIVSVHTNPTTPDHINAGPIAKMYSLTV